MLVLSTILLAFNTIAGFFNPIFWLFGILNIMEIVGVIKMITRK